MPGPSAPGRDPLNDPALRLRRLAQLSLLWVGLVLGPLSMAGDQLAQYFVVYQCDLLDLVLLALVAGPLPLAAMDLALRRVPEAAAAALHRLLVGTLAAAGLAAVLGALGLPTPGRWVVAVAALAAAGPWLIRRPADPGGARLVLGLAGLLALGLGLGSSLPSAVGGLGARAIEGAGLEADTPIVVVVFDALPLFYLLDCQGQLDAARFPNLAALAATSDWHRRVTAVHPYTMAAFPALLSGRYPDHFRYPTTSEFPGNLFTLVSRTHRVVGYEADTRLLDAATGGRNALGAHRGARLAGILQDAARALPLVLAGRTSAADLADLTPELAAFQVRGQGSKEGRFERFLAEVDGARPRSLYFFHSWLPHAPWTFLEDGSWYPPFHVQAVRAQTLSTRGGKPLVSYFWAEDPALLDQSLQRILLQARYADAQLGRLRARLEAEGLWDKALLVVTSDHGTRVGPGEPLRQLGDGRGGLAPHAIPQLLPVPLFVKRPGQAEGRTSDRPLELVDLLPSIADELGIEVPWPHHGVSWRSSAPPRAEHKVWDADYTPHTVRPDWDQVTAQACALRERFAEGGEDRFYRLRPHGDLLGQEVVERRDRSVHLAALRLYGGDRVRALVGEVHLADQAGIEKVDLGVVHEGRVVAVTTASQWAGRQLRFQAFVPAHLAPPPGARLELAELGRGLEGVWARPMRLAGRDR